jgi:imidazolonepropionase-like amidohydrolase
MIGNLHRAVLLFFLLASTAILSGPVGAQTLALVGGRVYPSANADALSDAVVLASGGVITALGNRSEIQIPGDARVIDCTGKTIVAGFWNSHVHFTQVAWKNAAGAPAASLEEHMRDMLTQWGFTTVWDLGSDPGDTLPLRRRVNSGEVPGPNILVAGNMFPKGGHPIYVPAEAQVPEVATPAAAAQTASEFLRMVSSSLPARSWGTSPS